MAKRTRATNWEVVCRDANGAMVNIDYVCPCCDMDTGELVRIGAHDVNKIDSGWEIDLACDICDNAIVVECR